MFGTTSSPFTSNQNTFGQPQQTSAFGAPSTSTPFGSTSTTGFSGFGSTANTTPAFGQQPSTFGVGGASSSVFGGTSGGFGGGFGSSAPAPSGGLFGSSAPAPSGGGLFGSSTTTNTGGGLFGSGGTSAFGAPAPSGGLFGSSAPSTTFGAATSAFGQSNTPAGGIFGAPSTSSTPFGQQQRPGTLGQLYQVTSRPDGSNNNIALHAITAMPAYENKSFEELRLEDYLAGNKGQSQQQPATAFGQTGGFGSTAFGSSAPAPSGGLFGSSAPAPSTGGIFGAPAPATSAFGSSTSTFGATPAPGSFAFGQQPAPAPSSAFSFGAQAPKPATTSLFGAPAPSTGLFGQQPAPAAAFGANTTAFGQTQPTSAFGFGSSAPAPSTGGLFGSAPTSTFGQTPAAPSTGLFGSAPAPLFGAPAPATTPSTGLFGTQAPTTSVPSTGLFSQPSISAPSTSLFGQAPAPSTGLFGNAAPSTSLFGQQPAPSAFGASTPAPPSGLFSQPAPSFFGNTAAVTQAQPTIHTATAMPSTEAILAQKLAVIEAQKKELALNDNWRGSAPSSFTVTPISNPEPSSNSPSKQFSNRNNTFHPYQYRPMLSTIHIRPRGLKKLTNNEKQSKPTIQNQPIFSPATFFASTCRKLTIDHDALDRKPKLLLTNVVTENSKTPDKDDLKNTPLPSPLVIQNGSYGTTPRSTRSSLDNPTSSKKNLMKDYAYYYDTKENGDTKYKPKLTKDGYETSPSIGSLAKMSLEELTSVSNFSIERPGYGKIEWVDSVDLSHTDLDSVIAIKDREVMVYHTEQTMNTKPAQGTKLNKPAIITLYNILPKNKHNATEKEKEKFIKKVRKQCETLENTTFISYDVDTGVWKFRVNHFSRYGLLDDDSDSEEEEEVMSKINQQSPLQTTIFQAPKEDSDDEEELLSHAHFNANLFSSKIKAAETAYSAIMLQMEGDEKMAEDDVELFTGGYYTQSKSNFIDAGFEGEAGICAELTSMLDITSASSSNQDFGFKMSHSFGMAWNTDNSIIHPLVSFDTSDKSKMIVAEPAINDDKSKYLSLLEIHLHHSNVQIFEGDDQVPFFTLPKSKNYLSLLLKDYISFSKQQFSTSRDTERTINNAFQLLFLLYVLDDTQQSSNVLSTISQEIVVHNSTNFENRHQNEAFFSWIQKCLSQDAIKEIQASLNENDVYQGIFIAYISGNLTKATSLANQHGLYKISSLLCSNNANDYIRIQLLEWKKQGLISSLPSYLHRLLLLLSGDQSLESAYYKKQRSGYFDWMKRLNMKSLCINDNDGIMSLISSYEADIQSSKVPPPLARHYTQNKNKLEKLCKLQEKGDVSSLAQHYCLLYRILLAFASNNRTQLSYIVSPKGHTPNHHDHSYAFHLSCLLTALGITDSLNDVEEDLVIDSYVSQLVNANSWEWAVYVTLCATNLNKQRRVDTINKAKELIMRHAVVEGFNQKREFLENKLRIPSSWFDEALAVRKISTADTTVLSPNKIFQHLVDCGQLMEALMVIEEQFIPKVILFGNSASKVSLKTFLEQIKAKGFDEIAQWNEPNGCGAYLDFITLQEDVSQYTRDNVSIHDVIDKEYIETLIVRGEAIKQKFSILPMISVNKPGEKKVERSVAHAESLSYLKRTLRQLYFLKENIFTNVPVIHDDFYQEVLSV